MVQPNANYKHKYVALLILALVAAFFPLLQGKFYAVGDMRDVFIPLEHFFQQEMLAGRLPSWNPDIAWGFPVIASAQIGFFYPPLLLLRLLPLQLYFPIILLGHFIALAIGTYLFLRALNLSRPASYLGSLSFTLSSFLIQHVSQLNVIITAAWFPWQLLLIHKITVKRKLTPRHFASLALIFGLPFLAGQLQIPAIIAIVAAAYFLYRRWKQHQEVLKPATKLLAIALTAALIAAAQLLPTFELATQSSQIGRAHV